MKKKYFKPAVLVTFIIILAFIILNDGVIFMNTIDNVSSIFKINDFNSINKYEMNIEIDDTNRVLSGKEKVTYFNRSNKTLDDIYFHVYPNAFNNIEALPVMFNDTSYAYPEGFNPCYIEISDISVDGKKINYSFSGVDNTILRLELNKPVKKDNYVEIVINFQLKIPESRDRIGYYEDSYVFGNWYPVAAVYDDTGWNLDVFYNIGDPFYSDMADYMVKITLPDKYNVASTGKIISNNAKDGKRTISIAAKSVRDFAWSASSKFQIYSKKVEGIEINYYFINTNNGRINKAISTGMEAIKIFNERFGKYPYSSYSIVESNFPTGMEYPGFILIPNSYFEDSKSMLSLEGVIVHETAHQWWYGVVGNNEIDEAWLDEGLATYSKVIYFENTSGAEFGKEYYKNNINSSYESKRKSIKGREIILKPLYEYESWREYDTLAYKKAAVIFHVIRNKIGDEKFFTVLRRYYNDNKFKNVQSEDIINTVEIITNESWDAFFDEWLFGK